MFHQIKEGFARRGVCEGPRAANLGLEDEDREANEEPVLDDSCDVHGEGAGLADQQEHAHVQAEGGRGVCEEYEGVKVHLLMLYNLSGNHSLKLVR